MRRMTDNVFATVLAVTLFVSGIVLILPVVLTIISSFDARGFVGSFPPEKLSLRWYRAFFESSYYMNALFYSLVIGLGTAVISSGLGFFTAVGIYYAPERVSKPLSVFFLAPLIIPGVVIGFALLFFFIRIHFPWSFAKILLAHVLITLPYTIRSALAGIDGIKQSIIESGSSLGATELGVILKVILPIAASSVATGAMFAFAFSLDDVAVTIFLTGVDVYTLPIAMVSNMKSDFNLSIAAASTFLIAITLGLVALLEYFVGVDKIVGRGIYG